MKTILIVEDEFDLLQSLSLALEIEGYKILTAGNGRTALELLKEIKPDLVITDVMMPYVSGYELSEALSRMPGYESVPSVLMSAMDRHMHPKGPWKALLAKPFTIDRLVKVVTELIGTPDQSHRIEPAKE
ncbi:response regulator [Ramlibacter sp. MMS24-I3-19]|uniref:response regulator n=1 Tax=Ramlibacter sp. MMS24-I3-19 TaxID=3416606 RepID=UPI003D03C404